ncbi:MAG TPA: DUF3037 domain-containing protein [Dongiaceae bacterium]|nr:DUF3037 domain-containing protein [Dongiaceae bacterium]
MAERKQFDYFFLSYVPNVTQLDSVCMAVVVLDSETGGESFGRMKTVEGWRIKVKQLDPNVDISFLQGILQHVGQQISDSHSLPAMIDLIENSFSNSLRASMRKKCEGEDLEEVLEALVASGAEAN